MIIVGPLLVIAGIGFFCWLLFTLAVFAFPFYAGLTVGAWAFSHGRRLARRRRRRRPRRRRDIRRRAIGARLRPLDLAPTRHRARLRCAGDGRRLLRHARNCPDGYALHDMADDFFARRRSRCRYQRFDPHHWSHSAGTGRNESRAGLTPLQLLLWAHVDLHLSEFIVVTRR